jgi:hypothetical protein
MCSVHLYRKKSGRWIKDQEQAADKLFVLDIRFKQLGNVLVTYIHLRQQSLTAIILR